MKGENPAQKGKDLNKKKKKPTKGEVLKKRRKKFHWIRGGDKSIKKIEMRWGASLIGGKWGKLKTDTLLKKTHIYS